MAKALLVLGITVWFPSLIWFIVLMFRIAGGRAFLYLACFPLMIWFALANWDEMRRPSLLLLAAGFAAALSGFMSGYGCGKEPDPPCFAACDKALFGCSVQLPLTISECAAWCEASWGRTGDRDAYKLTRIAEMRSCSIVEFELKDVYERRPPASLRDGAAQPVR